MRRYLEANPGNVIAGRQGGFAARGKERDGSAEFGSNLNRLLQSDGAPLLGPEHRQVGQALDAEPARKAALLRSLRQNGGDERKGQRHPDRALALALVDGERLDGLGGVE